MIARPAPVVDDREFDQRDRQFFNHNVLKNAHQGYFVAHLEAHVVA
jgi:hypothetical protein